MEKQFIETTDRARDGERERERTYYEHGLDGPCLTHIGLRSQEGWTLSVSETECLNLDFLGPLMARMPEAILRAVLQG